MRGDHHTENYTLHARKLRFFFAKNRNLAPWIFVAAGRITYSAKGNLIQTKERGKFCRKNWLNRSTTMVDFD